MWSKLWPLYVDISLFILTFVVMSIERIMAMMKRENLESLLR